MERLCVHAQKEPGGRSTRREHIPPEKISNPELGIGCQLMGIGE
jgi:hypothetical protein